MPPFLSSFTYIQNERISGGSAVIKGTRTRVVDIVIEYEYLVHSPDEIISAHPHLTLQQIHDALSYYYENREEIDKKIGDEQEFVRGLGKVFQDKDLR